MARPSCLRLAFVLLLAVPAAGAQQLGVDFSLAVASEPSDHLVPNVTTDRIVLRWEIACKGPASHPHGLLIPSALFQFEQPRAPPGISVTGPTTGTGEPPDCVTTMSTSGTHQFTVMASELAEGDTDLPIQFQARLLSAGPGSEEVPAPPVNATVRVAFLGLLRVDVPQTIQTGETGTRLHYPVHVENLGNAATQVHFRPGNDTVELGEVTLPHPTILRRGEAATFDVQVDLHASGQESIQFSLTPEPLVDGGEPGPTAKVNIMARAIGAPRGEAAPPVPAAALAAGLLAVAALARRRA